jgi:hypothetical protein
LSILSPLMATKQEAALATLGLSALQKKGFAPTFCQHSRYKDGARIVLEQHAAAPHLVIEVFPGPPSVAVVGTEITRQFIRGVRDVSPTSHGVQITAEYKGRRGITEVIPNEGILYTEETIPRPAFIPPRASADLGDMHKYKGMDGYEQLEFAEEKTEKAEKVQLTGFVGSPPYYGPGKKQGGGTAFHFTFSVHPNPADPQDCIDYNVHAYDSLATRFARKKLKVGQKITIIGWLREREVETAKGTHLTRHINAALPPLASDNEKKTATRPLAPSSSETRSRVSQKQNPVGSGEAL